MAKQQNTVTRRTQAERRHEAESRMIASAIQLIATRGFDGFSLAEVADAAGYSRTLPVHYFGSREGFLGMVAESLIQVYHGMLAELPDVGRGLPRLCQMVRQYVEVSPSPDLKALGILIAHAAVLPMLSDKLLELGAQGQQALEEEIREGQRLGNIRPGADARLTAAMVYAFLRGQLGFALVDKAFDGVAVGERFLEALDAYIGAAPSAGRGPAASTKP